jgi:pimeloyl-ACP methyl ester carboxylesterase
MIMQANPDPTAAAARAVEFVLSAGVSLRGDAWGDPARPPVLLLHGGGQTRHAWAGTAEALGAQGWYAIALDLRGHGDSDWHPDGDYGFQTFANDVREVARQIGRPIVLVGASLGGVASLLAVHESEPPIATGLVLVDVATRLEREGVDRIIDFMRGGADGFASLDEAADAVAAYNPHRRRPSDPSGLKKNLRLGDDGRWRWHWDPRFLEHSGPTVADPSTAVNFLDDAARSLRIPTLLVRGGASDVLSEEGARVFLELVPHAKFADITEAGHMVAGDRNDIFSEAVIDFLREADLGSA